MFFHLKEQSLFLKQLKKKKKKKGKDDHKSP